MSKSSPEILVYITNDEKRVLGGDPLTLYIPDETEKKNCITDLSHALKANVVQMRNGDYLIITNPD